MKEFIQALAFIGVLLIVIVSAVTTLVGAQCKAQWQDTFPVKFDPIAGCRIQVDGKWIPSKNYLLTPGK